MTSLPVTSLPVLQRGGGSAGRAGPDHRGAAGRLPGARKEQPDPPLRLAPPPSADDVTSCRVRGRIRAASHDEVQFGLNQQSLRSEMETKEEDFHRKRVTLKPWKHISF